MIDSVSEPGINVSEGPGRISQKLSGAALLSGMTAQFGKALTGS